MTALYNEIDPFAAAWLRENIKAGLIAPGDVDERDIRDIRPSDLRGYTQFHAFAGIGVWSYALRRAGWPDDRPAWSMSCPCQPFSAAGKGLGFADERHLWPAAYHLIRECRPSIVFGEQVASKAVDPWIDLVQADLEAVGYAVGAVPFPSAGVGAPHIRDRTYWLADANGSAGRKGRAELRGRLDRSDATSRPGPSSSSMLGGLDDDDDARLERHAGHGGRTGREAAPGSASEASLFGGMADAHDNQPRLGRNGRSEEGEGLWAEPGRCGDAVWMADASSERRQQVAGSTSGDEEADGRAGRLRVEPDSDHVASGHVADRDPGPTNGIWRDADWLFCRDGKWRPVEPGTFPLAHGAAARVGRLRGYGNAINAEAAVAFIESYLDCPS